MKTCHLVMLAALAATACGGAGSPTGPSGAVTAQAPSAQATASSVSLGVTGQMVAGQFNYWVRVGVAAGSKEIVINRIDFRYPESAQAPPFGGLGYVTMNHTLPPGRNYTHENELISTVAVSELTVTVSYTDGAGQPGQLSTSAAVPATVQGAPSLTLRVDAFTVTGFMAGTRYAYWPKLTLTASPGVGSITVTRIHFELGRGLADRGSSFPSTRRTHRIDAGATLLLFHQEFYGEPEFYLDSTSKADEMTVRISYVDDAGRGADVVAVAAVTR